MSYMQFKTPFMELYEELSKINTDIAKTLTEAFSGTPKQTTELVDLNTCREVVTTKYDPHVGAYETNCITTVNGQLSRIEVRVFVLKRENGEIKFLGRKCNRSTGYTTPGGGYDLVDKTPINTAKRELHEELGITLTNIQESTIHTFKQHGVRNGGSSWVRQYVENPGDRWTGYYQYYITAEFGGSSSNDNPAEVCQYTWIPISVFNDPADKCGPLMLQIINGHSWADSAVEGSLDEAFGEEGSEVIYGEASKTIPGVLRYFVEDIPTLLAILNQGKILASAGEPDPDTKKGEKFLKKRPFVSFSHQLFSHAYRSPSKWKYGITVSQEKLEQSIEKLPGANTKDGFKHPGRSMYVYGAAKQANGAELLITSFGHFEMNLSDDQRKALGNLEKTGYFEQVKVVFNEYLERMRKEKTENPTDTLTADSFYCTEAADVIKRYLKTDVDVLEGFLLIDRRPSVGLNFPKLYEKVPGLLDYLQTHTTLNEGEFRVWLPDGQKWLDIKDCITGLVLPSNYKQENYDNLQNTAPDVLSLRRRVKNDDLAIYVYQSNDKANLPDLDLSIKRKNTLEKPSITDYFHEITSTREAVINFVKNKLTKYTKSVASAGFAQAYAAAVASSTTTTAAQDVYNNKNYNYNAFLAASQEYGLTKKDIHSIYHTGKALPDAKDVFNEKTESTETVNAFMQQLGQDFQGKQPFIAYHYWFVSNTNATGIPGGNTINPGAVDWNSFVAVCTRKFNYTNRDLNALFHGKAPIKREPIKVLFKKVANTSKKLTLDYIKLFASEYPTAALTNAYTNYMGKYTTDSSRKLIMQDPNYNYQAWLASITDPVGPVKLTKEEIKSYFNSCKNVASAISADITT